MFQGGHIGFDYIIDMFFAPINLVWIEGGLSPPPIPNDLWITNLNQFIIDSSENHLAFNIGYNLWITDDNYDIVDSDGDYLVFI